MTLQEGTVPIRVLCVDDHVIIGMAMRATIDAAPDMICVGCLERADTLLEAVKELIPARRKSDSLWGFSRMGDS
jgi:chemotaxis response regulator CheB